MQLSLKNLCVERGNALILKDISLNLSKGEGIELRGANGSGKTTLLRTIAGLLPKVSGEIHFENENQDEKTLPQACHYLGDKNAMKEGLSVSHNLKFWQDYYGNALNSIDEALEILGLLGAAHLPYDHLSKGQRRRIALAKLLISHRPIWLLDEPTSGLDAQSERLFATLVKAHLDQGGMALIASHIPIDLDLTIFQLGQK